MNQKRTLLLAIGLIALVLLPLGLALSGAWNPQNANASLTDEFKCVFVPAEMSAGSSNWKRIDGFKLSNKMENALEDLAAEGYKVISIAPINQGRMVTANMSEASWGAGYSTTQGMLISAQKP